MMSVKSRFHCVFSFQCTLAANVRSLTDTAAGTNVSFPLSYFNFVFFFFLAFESRKLAHNEIANFVKALLKKT